MLKILISVDGSENSSRAVRYYIEASKNYAEQPEVHLLNVQAPIASGNVKRYISNEQLNRYHEEEGEAALAPARALLDAAGVKYAHHIGLGDVGETVAQFARDKQVNQIIIGTRGLGSVSGMIMGSAATRILHAVDVPVLMVK